MNKIKEYPDSICRVCGDKTQQGFNIKLKFAHICHNCESSIVRQSVIDSEKVENKYKKELSKCHEIMNVSNCTINRLHNLLRELTNKDNE